MATTFEHRKIDKLRNHPLNAQVFGEISADNPIDAEFVESIRQRGVLQPLIISGNDLIISGHRRRQGAARAGLKEVPVIVRRDLTDDHDVNMAWFDANRDREKTTEQKARWFKSREEFLAKQAEKRMKSGGNGDPAQNFTQGRAAETAAKEVGMSRPTAKAAVAVVEAIDTATAKGDQETAEKLRDTLNNKSVSAAKREADKVVRKPKPKRKKPSQPKGEIKAIDSAAGTVSRALSKAGEKHGQGEHYTTIFDAISDIKKAVAEWMKA